MSEPTPSELADLEIQKAIKRHTPAITELPVRRHYQFDYQYGRSDCDGELEVIDVSPGWGGYGHVFLCCKECGEDLALDNPKRDVVQTPAQKKPQWRDHKRAASGEKDIPF